jgi:hypothetical protein
MISIKNGKVLAFILILTAGIAHAAKLTVSQQTDGGGAYRTIMSAVNAAHAGDSVVILDQEQYKEQVTIDSTKGGLVLCSDNPKSSKKPTVVFQDKINVGPTTCADAKIDSKITFDQNGALQIKRVRGVVIDGIAVDGGGPYAFGYPGIWKGATDCQWALQHGNAGITIWMSGDAIVRNCDIRNAYFGIAFKDRNLGGINANVNSADIDTELNVPLSGFGKTGSHLIEQNRIHDNSVGIYFESTWDLATIIRYNLIYENHHSTTAFATKVKDLTAEGNNQPGGAMMFKDHLYSPVAIYNNTFWHNYLIFIGGWRPGKHYLIFNNIYGEPFTYWSSEPVFQNSFMALDPVFVNRMHNCVYAAQTEKAKPQIEEVQEYDQDIQEMIKDTFVKYQVRIMNGFGEVEAVNLTVNLVMSDSTVLKKPIQQAKIQGNRIVGAAGKPFPASANIRWLETKFKSTKPDSPDFLVPDWDDSLVHQYILDQGWNEAGLTDADGSPADLGAIPFGGKQTTVATIRQLTPVMVDQNNATKAIVSFDFDVKAGTFSNPEIKYIRWICPIPQDTNDFGGNGTPLATSAIIKVDPPKGKIVVGANEKLEITIPAMGASTQYGYFEMVIEGTDQSGSKVQSAVGFLSYRRLDYIFDVYVLNLDMTDTLDEVYVGDPYILRIVPKKVSAKNTAFTSKVDTVDVSLQSPFTLWGESDKDTFRIVGGIPANAGKSDKKCMFTKVPDGGFEAVAAAGIFKSGSNNLAIWGISSKIKVNPGAPEKVMFLDPPSHGRAVIDPGAPYDVYLQVYDKYDNKVAQKTDVSLASLRPTIGKVEGPETVTSNDSGVAKLQVMVDEGQINDTFPIVGTLKMNNNTDSSTMVVGKARAKFFIYYSDTTLYDPSVAIPVNTCTGVRVPVQIKSSTNGFEILKDINNEFSIEFNTDLLVAYASDSGNDTTKIKSAKLVNGVAKIYVQATKGSIRDGIITISNITPTPKVFTGSRKGINFTSCIAQIKKADYYADNGKGAVDQLDIYYVQSIKESEIPDSVEIFWPNSGDNRKLVSKTNMKLDPNDATHVIVTLPQSFPEGITVSTTQDLGTSYWKNPNLTEGTTVPFKINDKVGPIIKKAVLIERLEAGKSDTIIVAFSEYVQLDKISGEALQLTKAGGVVLNVLSVSPVDKITVKVAIENKGEGNSPKEGDSLKIYVKNGVSEIVDADGNSAHPDNQPVELFIQEISPSITSAAYYDRNGDGMVDSIALAFNKKVKINDQAYVVFFGSNIKADTIKSDGASYIGNDSMKLALDLTGKLPQNAIGKTSGGMVVSVENKRYIEPVTKDVADSAAPVILDTVWYYQGAILEDETQASDTLRVRFSEAMKHQDVATQTPFVFFTGNGQEYRVTLQYMNQNNSLYEFRVVKSSPEALTPTVASATGGDRVMVNVDNNTSPFADESGNIQKVTPNRKALLMLKEQPVNLSIKVGPSPFFVNGSDSIKIIIQPKTTKDKKVDMMVRVVILDNLGNCVYNADRKIDSDAKIELGWKGINKKGRIVGTGTYALFIETTDNDTKTVIRDKARKIAVKKN